ncbi:hypothetical protein ACFOY2_14665 [Nonomuraea purpurea]|uniref:SnoaL-like domain-containing protein n=1 Tax=Nonomuraea purpurea TaxID=1849276 RepID=A0ABV8G5T9_9ACTN
MTNATNSSSDIPMPGNGGITVAEHLVARARRWVSGWDKKSSDGPFSIARNFSEDYDFDSADVMISDDMDPEHRVMAGPHEYGIAFDPMFNSLRGARHMVFESPTVLLGPDAENDRVGAVAASRLMFVAILEADDGTITAIRTTSSQVWRRAQDRWRIIREHNSSVSIDVAEAEKLLDFEARTKEAEGWRALVSTALNR